MSKLTRNPQQYYENYTEVVSKIDGAVEFASILNAIKIGNSLSENASNFNSVSASGDEAVESLVQVAKNISNQLNVLAIAANKYGSEIEPLYEKVQTQLQQMQKQEEVYKNLCNDGPDDQDDKYYKTVNGNKEFQPSLYNPDVANWNDKLNNYETQLQNMCTTVDTIINQLLSVSNADILSVAESGFNLTISNVIPFVDDSMIGKVTPITINDGQAIVVTDNPNDNTSSENIEWLTYTYQTAVGPTTIYYAIIPKDQQPNLAIATDSNGKITRKLPWNLAAEVGAKVAINFSVFGDGRAKPRDGGEGISYDGEHLFIGKHYNCDTTLYMDKDGNLGYINGASLKSKDDVAQTLKEKNVKWAAKCFYPIIDNYKYVNNNTDPNIGSDYSRHPRTFFGQLDNGDYIMGVSSGRNKDSNGVYQNSMTLKEVGDFVQNHATDNSGNKINVRFLMNGDGGGSTAFVVDGEKKNVSGQDRPTTDIIYVT